MWSKKYSYNFVTLLPAEFCDADPYFFPITQSFLFFKMRTAGRPYQTIDILRRRV